MKINFLFFLIFIVSCTPRQHESKRTSVTADTISSKTVLTDTINPNTEIIETFVDSLNIGKKGETKIELIKHRVFDEIYVIIKFYTKGTKYWYRQNTYLYECTAIQSFNPIISDFNNDKFNDITFISSTAARGANEVRRLFIYNDNEKQLISIVNSDDFPNMQYNNELDCIDAFLVHGTSTTVFAKITKDSLKSFANVYNDMDFHTVTIDDKNGKEKVIKKVKSKGVYIRFKNFNPLEEYSEE
jgi:hypothetical protein